MVATPYTDRNFLFASAEGRIDRFLPIFFWNIPFVYVTRPQKFFWDHSIILLARKWVVFFQGGHFLKYVVRIWEMLGRTAVVMIIMITLRLKLFCPHFWDCDHIFQKGIYINIEWLWLLHMIICTHQCTMISRLIVISPFQVCSAVVFNAGACSRLCT